jgi:hypothetical protein
MRRKKWGALGVSRVLGNDNLGCHLVIDRPLSFLMIRIYGFSLTLSVYAR